LRAAGGGTPPAIEGNGRPGGFAAGMLRSNASV
jgi:hypothetical protein